MLSLSLIALPLAGALAVAVAGDRRGWPGAALGALATTAVLGTWSAAVESSASLRWSDALDVTLSTTGFARVMVVVVPAVAACVVWWAVAEAAEHDLRRLAVGLLAFVGAMELVVSAADLLALLIGWELVAVASWVLISHDWRDAGKPRLATEAFVTTRVGDLGLFVAAGAAVAGGAGVSLAYTDLASIDGTWLGVLAFGVLLAAAAKSAQVPFSPWLFSAMAGPTPVSALLHSATMVAAGAYVLVRLSPALTAVGWFEPATFAVGMLGVVAGGIVAAGQRDAKRALAGSTTAQYGLMFVAIGVGSPGAAAAQLVAHALFKSLLFLGAGIGLHETGTLDLRAWRLGRARPKVAIAFGVGAAALAALPPLGGAFSKEAIVAAAFERDTAMGLGVLAAGALSAFYAARLALLAYGPGREAEATAHRAGVAPLTLLALASIGLGTLWIPPVADRAGELAGVDLPGGTFVELGASLAVVLGAITLAYVADARGRLARRVAVADSWFWLPAISARVIVAPVLASSRVCAAIDRHIVDAGVDGAARIAGAVSHLANRLAELRLDAVVRGTGGATLAAAGLSRAADDHGVDGAVDGLAEGVGVLGRLSRRVQTGLSHHYFVLVVGGAVLLVVLAAWR